MKFINLLLCLASIISCSLEEPNMSITKTGNYNLKSGSISGKITDKSGKGLIGVTVVADNAGFSTVSGVDGKYILQNVDAESNYKIVFIKNGFSDSYIDSIFVTSGDTLQNMDIALNVATCVITGKVVYDETLKNDSSTLEGIGISIPQQSKSTISDVNGNFSIHNIETNGTGDELIIAAKSGGGWGDNKITLTAGEVINVELKLTKVGGVIKGYLYDATNQPLSGVEISGLGGGISATTLSDGSYELTNVPSDNSINIQAKDKNGNIYTSSGLEVNDECSLEGVKLAKTISTTGSIVTRDKLYYVNNIKSNIILNADIVSGDSLISSFVWDINNDKKFEKITSKNQFIYQLNTLDEQIVNYAIVSINGDTTSTSKITIKKVSSQPTVKISSTTDKSLSINQPGKLNIDVECLNGGIKSYKWDFNGDGNFDWTNFSTGNLIHRFFDSGVFTSKIEVSTLDNIKASDSTTINVSTAISTVDGDFIFPPKLIYPLPNSSVSSSVNVTWSSVQNAEGYNVYLSETYPFTDIAITNTSGYDTTAFFHLEPDKKYFIQIESFGLKAKNSSYTSVFTTNTSINKPTIALYSPISGDTISGDDSLTISWNVYSASFPDNLTSKLHFGPNNPPNFYNNNSTTTYRGYSVLTKVMPLDGFKEGWYYISLDGFDGNDSLKSNIDSVYIVAPREWVEVNHLGTSTASYQSDPCIVSLTNSDGSNSPLIYFQTQTGNPVVLLHNEKTDNWDNITPAAFIGATMGYGSSILHIASNGNNLVLSYNSGSGTILLKYDYNGTTGTWTEISSNVTFDILQAATMGGIADLAFDGTNIYVIVDDYGTQNYSMYNGSNWSSPELIKSLITPLNTDTLAYVTLKGDIELDVTTKKPYILVSEVVYPKGYVHIVTPGATWTYQTTPYEVADNIDYSFATFVVDNGNINLLINGYDANLSTNTCIPLKSTVGSTLTTWGAVEGGSEPKLIKDYKNGDFYYTVTQYDMINYIDISKVFRNKSGSWESLGYNGETYIQSGTKYPTTGVSRSEGGLFLIYGDNDGKLFVWKY